MSNDAPVDRAIVRRQTTHCPDGYKTCAVHNVRDCDRGGQCRAHLTPATR